MMAENIHFLLGSPELKTTLLYGFDPQAVGTGQVEHLQSHLLTLAFEHCLPIKKLVDRVLHPLCHNSSKLNMVFGWSACHGRPMLGIDHRTRDWINVLEHSTGRDDLIYTTLFPLGNVINGEHLLLGHLQHCTLCFKDDIDRKRRPFRRLLWQTKHVTCCPIHRIYLEQSTCGAPEVAKVHPTKRVNLGGVCSDCGSIGYKCVARKISYASNSDVWTSVQIQEVIANLNLVAEADLADIKSCFLKYANESDGLNFIAIRAGIARSLLWRWVHNPNAKMSLGHSLKLAAATGIPLLGLLTGDLTRKDVEIQIDIERARKAQKVVNLSAIKERLQRAIETPVTLKKVADEFDVSTEFVRRHFPELVAEMKNLFGDLKVKNLSVMRSKDLQEVESVLLSLWRQNKTPSIRNAGLETGVLWYPSSLKARIFNELRTELGWKSPETKGYLEFSPAMRYRINYSRYRIRNAMLQTKHEII